MKEKNAVTPWFIYIIKTKYDTLYCGITTDVERRFSEHCSQGVKCAKYLRGKAPLELVYQQSVADKSTALKYEYKIKRLKRKHKLPLIEGSSKMVNLTGDLEIDVATQK